MRQIHTEGMRYTGAREYGVNDLPALLKILADEDEAMYWPNATMVLGAIGDGAAVEPLIKVVEGRHNEQPRPPSTVTYRGHRSTLFGLGLLDGTDAREAAAAVEYLLESTRPETWAER